MKAPRTDSPECGTRSRPYFGFASRVSPCLTMFLGRNDPDVLSAGKCSSLPELTGGGSTPALLFRRSSHSTLSANSTIHKKNPRTAVVFLLNFPDSSHPPNRRGSGCDDSRGGMWERRTRRIRNERVGRSFARIRVAFLVCLVANVLESWIDESRQSCDAGIGMASI